MSVALLAAWLHDLSPFAVRFWGGFGLRWYGLSYAIGFVIAWIILRWLITRGAAQIPRDRAADAIILMAIGAVVGGRLGYAMVYEQALFWTFTRSLPWWRLLDLTRGGMSAHGGIVGVILAAWRVSRGFRDMRGERVGRTSYLHVLDLTAMLAPFGLFLGRIANFINGELLGRIVAMPGEPAPWWAVKFPQEVLSEHAPTLTPEQEMALARLIDEYSRPGDVSFSQVYERILERLQNGAPDLAERLEPLIAARHPSQLYQAFAEGVVVGAIVWLVARVPRKPGVVGCAFLIAYGASRIITEIWRLPDAHLHVQRILGLSRGQWLSAAMVVIGLVILMVLTRRGNPRSGGWSRPRTLAGGESAT